MKIVCDSCSTKYSISDDKVRGKVFKIRCKKCSHIIVVKGTADAAPAAAEAPSDAIWHLVVDGDQVGPLTDADVRARLARNEISSENYVWKEGFTDWLRLAEVPAFGDVALASAPVAGELFSDNGRADATEAGERDADMGAFFGSGAPADASRSEGVALSAGGGHSSRTHAPAPGASVEEDAFSAPRSSAGSPSLDGGDLFGAVAPMAAHAESGRVRGGRATNGTGPAARHDGGRVESLTGQRSENSVLFSLSNLQSLAAPSPMAKPGTTQATEGSGLIDIRAMAASTLKAPGVGGVGGAYGSDSKSAENDLPTFGAFSSAAPVLLALPSSGGPPKWVYVLVGLGLVMAISVVIAAVSILSRPVMVEQPAAPVVAPVAAPVAAPRPLENKNDGTAKALAVGELPPREGGEASGATADKPAGDKPGAERSPLKGARKTKGKRTGGGPGSDGKTASGSASAGASASSAPAEPEKAKPAKGSLDDLLEGALNGRKARPKVDDDAAGAGARKTAEAPSSGPLAKAAVVAGMNGVKGKVAACYAQFKVPGMAMVNVVIGKSGKVSSAAVTGKFAGTPTGTCVESAVKTASFPPSEGLTTPYPFSLR